MERFSVVRGVHEINRKRVIYSIDLIAVALPAWGAFFMVLIIKDMPLKILNETN